MKLTELEKLSISDLWAIKQYLEDEIKFWEKDFENETQADKYDRERTSSERQLYLDWIEEILSRKIFYFDQ